MSEARQRIVDVALELFARQGFAGTSVAQIEAAAGLKPGAGGLYAHFGSKSDLLAAAVERSVALSETGYSMLAALPLQDLRSELTIIARGSFVLFDAAELWVRIFLREGERFDDLFAEARDTLTARPYRFLAELLGRRMAAGDLDEHDPEAVADILFGAIANHWMQTRVFGWRPNGVTDDAFIAAWIDLALRLSPSY